MKKIIRKDFNPHFRDDNIADGILTGLEHLTNALSKSEYSKSSKITPKLNDQISPKESVTNEGSTSKIFIILVLVAVIFILRKLTTRHSFKVTRRILDDDFYNADESYTTSNRASYSSRTNYYDDDSEDNSYGSGNDGYSSGDGASDSWDS